jgi:hypothetical protein
VGPTEGKLWCDPVGTFTDASISPSLVGTGTFAPKLPLFHPFPLSSAVRTAGSLWYGKYALRARVCHKPFHHKALESAGSCRTFPSVGPNTGSSARSACSEVPVWACEPPIKNPRLGGIF